MRLRLLLVRHAIAVDRAEARVESDAERPLTRTGIRRMRRAASGLAVLVPVLDRIFSSPLVRAVETAALIAHARPDFQAPELARVLSPGHAPEEVVLWLAGLDAAKKTVCLVGHEPGLSSLLAHLIGARDGRTLTFRKGGAALLDVEVAERKSALVGATLLFVAPPRLLRRVR